MYHSTIPKRARMMVSNEHSSIWGRIRGVLRAVLPWIISVEDAPEEPQERVTRTVSNPATLSPLVGGRGIDGTGHTIWQGGLSERRQNR
jgi:hypothetical protein